MSNIELKKIDISWSAIFKILAVIVAVYFIYLIKSLLVWFVFALVISILFEPAIEALTKRKISRLFAVIFVYFLILGLSSLIIYISLPFLISEIQHFSQVFPQKFPAYFEKASPIFQELGLEKISNIGNILDIIKKPFLGMSQDIFSTILIIFGGIFSAFFTISLAIFISLEKNFIERILKFFLPKKYEEHFLSLWKNSKEKVIGWFLMRIIGVIFLSLSSCLAFRLININYPISLGALFGVSDFIPIVGPTISAILILMIVSIEDVFKGILVLIAMCLVAAIENIVLFPALSKKIIKISPILVLAGLFIGGKIWGIAGVILFVPLLAILFEFFKDFLREKLNG
jgi:predicted PurR-regulated permease PerM